MATVHLLDFSTPVVFAVAKYGIWKCHFERTHLGHWIKNLLSKQVSEKCKKTPSINGKIPFKCLIIHKKLSNYLTEINTNLSFSIPFMSPSIIEKENFPFSSDNEGKNWNKHSITIIDISTLIFQQHKNELTNGCNVISFSK